MSVSQALNFYSFELLILLPHLNLCSPEDPSQDSVYFSQAFYTFSLKFCCYESSYEDDFMGALYPPIC